MALKRKTKSVLGIIFVILLIVSLAFFVSKTFTIGSTSSGLTVQSISPTQFISSNTDLNNVFFLITANTGGGQSIVGDLVDGQDFKSFSGYQTQYPLQISAQSLDEKVYYKIANTGSSVYSMQRTNTFSPQVGSGSCQNWGSLDNYFTQATDAPACPSGTDFEIPIKVTDVYSVVLTRDLVCQRICVDKIEQGVTGSISPSSVQSQVVIDLTARGEKISKTVGVGQDANGNLISPSVDFVSSNSSLGLVATVQDVGKLWSGNFVPDSNPYKAFFSIGSNSWKITNNERITDYNNKITSAEDYFDTWKENVVVTDINSISTGIDSKISLVNSVVNSMKSDSFAIGGSQTILNPSDKNNGQVVITAPTSISASQLVFKVKAKWVGVNVPVGQPSIVSKSCPTYNAGEDGKIILSVKNIGSATGNFVPTISCDTGLQSYNQPVSSVLAGQTVDLVVPINAGTFAGTKLDNCKIKVVEYNYPSIFAESSVSCQIQTPRLCSEAEGSNGFSVSGNCIKQCLNGERTDVKCCSSDEKVTFSSLNVSNSLGGYACEKIQGLPTPNTCENLPWYDVIGMLKCFFSGINALLNVVKWMLLLAVSIFSIFYSRDFAKKLIGKSKEGKIASMIIGILIGVGIAYFLYIILLTSLFWWILGVVALIGIVIKFVIPFA